MKNIKALSLKELLLAQMEWSSKREPNTHEIFDGKYFLIYKSLISIIFSTQNQHLTTKYFLR